MANRTKVVGVADLSKALGYLINLSSSGHMRIALTEGGLVIERKAKENIKKQGLIDLGNLRASIETMAVSDMEVWVGTGVIYAAIHEFGGVITAKNAPMLVFPGRDGGLVMVHSVRIPARPYLLPAFNEGKQEAINRIADTLRLYINGAGTV